MNRVAGLHFKAMTLPQAKGQRFIAVAGKSISFLDTANILKEKLGRKASKVPAKEIPDWLIRLLAIFNPKLKQIVPLLGSVKHASNEKAKKLLDWKPRSNEEAILATANNLIDLKIVNV